MWTYDSYLTEATGTMYHLLLILVKPSLPFRLSQLRLVKCNSTKSQDSKQLILRLRLSRVMTLPRSVSHSALHWVDADTIVRVLKTVASGDSTPLMKRQSGRLQASSRKNGPFGQPSKARALGLSKTFSPRFHYSSFLLPWTPDSRPAGSRPWPSVFCSGSSPCQGGNPPLPSLIFQPPFLMALFTPSRPTIYTTPTGFKLFSLTLQVLSDPQLSASTDTHCNS
ncbi:hypothetical protein B0H66DRAFT_232256 [Apodospora peruviana]|uniref:Uncharacterized protein n=1 Tax=Apodospora peruviana TaxID=516989 RepID=A0AAE0M3S5_9PEZI|nr:hypothetical protein B0H66DRAFT_232256 [Apodospora peruviana]